MDINAPKMPDFIRVKSEVKEEPFDEENMEYSPTKSLADSDPLFEANPELLKSIKEELIAEHPFDKPDYFSTSNLEGAYEPGPSTSGTLYSCDNCNFTTDKAMIFEIHARDCALEPRYSKMVTTMLFGIKQRCYFCEFECSDLDVLKMHHTEHTEQGDTANFQCDKCAYNTENRFQLVSHTLTHNKFKCEQCPYFHTYERSVIKHSKNHSFSIKLIAACTSCSFEAVDPGLWEGHLTAHKLSGQAVEISCAGCFYKSTAPFNQRYVEVHQKESKHRGFLAEITSFKCTQCSYESYFKWDFIQHNKTCHPDSTPTVLKVLSCGKCAYVAPTKCDLKEHFQKKHDRIVYKCDGCQFQTRRKERYELHALNVSLTQRHHKHGEKLRELIQYKCQTCHFQATSESDLKTHNLLHKTQELVVSVQNSEDSPEEKNQVSQISEDLPEETNKESEPDEKVDLKRENDEINLDPCKKLKTSPYKCFYCDFEADQKIEVDRHEKTVHRTFDGLFTCPYCAYETTKRCDLRRHYTRKHQNSFKCGDCAYESSAKSDFIQHRAGHKRIGLALFQCSVCEYTNHRKSMVKRHELTHRDMCLFCDVCDYKTRRKDDLTRHKKRHQPTYEIGVEIKKRALSENRD